MGALFLIDTTIDLPSIAGEITNHKFDSVQRELERSLSVLAFELANRLAAEYVSVSFFEGASHLIGGAESGNIEFLYGSKIFVSILESDGVLHVQNLHQNEKYSSDLLVCGFPCIRSFVGALIRGRKNEVVGAICAFSSSSTHFSDNSARIVKSYAGCASTILEVVNASETLKSIKTINNASKAIDQLVCFGYKEVAEHVLSCIYNSQ